jgi:hypothetical protein
MKLFSVTIFHMFLRGDALFKKGIDHVMKLNASGSHHAELPEDKWVLQWPKLYTEDMNKGSDSMCLKGVPNAARSVCCSALCWTCDLTEKCADPTVPDEYKKNCCPGAIVANDESCDRNMAPCRVDPGYTAEWQAEQSAPIDSEAHERHVVRVAQRQCREKLFYGGKTKYDFAFDIAMQVKKDSIVKVDAANEKVTLFESKLAKMDNSPNDAMRKFRWEQEAENAKEEARFYGEIERNADWVMQNASNGLLAIDKMKIKIQFDVNEVPTCYKSIDDLETKSLDVYGEAQILWKQWEDSGKTYDCNPMPTVSHAESMCKQLNTQDRNCDIKCEVGFDGVGSRNSLRCIKQGTFGKLLFGELTGFASCLGRSCGLPPIMDKAYVTYEEVRYPNSAQYFCADGYTMDGTVGGQTKFEMACSYEGTYPAGKFIKQDYHVCRPVSCGTFGVQHSLSLSREYFFSESVQIVCEEGYTINGLASGNKAFSVTCMANGGFSAVQKCQPVRCGPPPSTTGSKLVSKVSGDQYYPVELEYECDNGYSLDQRPSGSKSFTLQCSSGGDFVWTENRELFIPHCRRVSAGMSPLIEYGFYARREMFFEDSVWVFAETGYSIGGLPDQGLMFLMTVSADGNYEGVQRFQPVSCGHKPDIEHGHSDFKGSDIKFGDVLTYDCDPGYSWDATKAPKADEFTLRCEADASLSKIPGLGTCANIDDCLGHTCGPFGYCVDELMNYTCICDSGFDVTTDKETGEYTCGNIDDCGPEACGVGKCIDGLNTYTCNCPTGYEETTDVEETTCTAVVCGTPPEVEHASTQPLESATHKMSFSAVTAYQCATGYTLDGKVGGRNHFDIDCQADRSFTATSTCQAVSCGSSPPYKDASKSRDSGVFGETVSYTCAHGYTIDGTAEGDTSFDISCQSNGQFSSGFDCSPIQCGEPAEIANSGRASGARTFGEVVTYTCFEGFTIDGKRDSVKTFEATCGEHGHFEVTAVHACHAVVCGVPSLDVHVLHASAPEKEISYPQAAEVVCRDGYTLKGDPHGASSFTIGCMADGEFEAYDAHACQAVKCGPVPPMANATLRFVKSLETSQVVTSTSFDFNMMAVYDCLPGFTVGGSFDASTEVHASCQDNGQYSFPKKSMTCLNVNDCAFHTCGPFGQCVDEIGPSPAYTCNCDPGYAITTQGSGEKHCGNINDCKGHDCGSGTCKDLVEDYTCICPVGNYIGEKDGQKTCLPVSCDSKAPVAGKATLKDKSKADKPFVFPYSLSYTCLEGFSLDGTASETAMEFGATCNEYGNVDGLLTCQPIQCGVPHAFSFVHLANMALNHHMLYGEKAKYECDKGYTIGGSATDIAKFEVDCLKTGVQSDPKVCQPVLCGNAPEVKNGHPLLAGHILYGMTLEYKCEQGYTLDGRGQGRPSFNITCRADGQFSAMPSTEPCKAVSAGETPKISNAILYMYEGAVVNVETVTAYYPHVVEWKCKDGYTDSGHPGGQKVFHSQVNYRGEFDPAPPSECKRVVYKISGECKNSRNGQGLDGCEAELVGTGQKVIATNGFFTLENVPAGDIQIKYTASGYIDNTREITVTGDVNNGGAADINMSPKMAANQWRATIKWGPYPRDLDTYVKFGAAKMCWYGVYQAAYGLTARLEHDDTDGYGPETAYLTGVGDCQYGANYCDMKYMINDYTRTNKMAEHEAEVTLYNGDHVTGTWKIGDCRSSVSDDQLWWHVFTVDGKTNELKWDCHQSASTSVLLRTDNKTQVDFDSYVGPFPGRYWRHSRHHGHSTANATSKASSPKAVANAVVKTTSPTVTGNATSPPVSATAIGKTTSLKVGASSLGKATSLPFGATPSEAAILGFGTTPSEAFRENSLIGSLAMRRSQESNRRVGRITLLSKRSHESY